MAKENTDFHLAREEAVQTRPGFFQALASDLVDSAYTYAPQHDVVRFGPRPAGSELSDAQAAQVAEVGFVRREDASPEELAEILRNLDPYAAGYDLLRDEESRAVYVRILSIRAFGMRHARLPLDYELYWQQYQKCLDVPSLDDGFTDALGLKLGLYDLRPFGEDLTLRCTPGVILSYCFRGQYHLQRPGVTIGVEPGDVVIDGGAAWGDTALVFASKAGATGRVYAVECMASNIEIYSENMERNPDTAQRVELVEAALWDRSDVMLDFNEAGPGSRVTGAGEGASGVKAVAIDDLVARHGLPRVDFIKMDIEGSERAALDGAAETLRRFRPKLAISAYHRLEDISSLTQFLHDLDVGYEFYMEHYRSHREETVLYARPTR
jgi:FkbM family methyltransferase